MAAHNCDVCGQMCDCGGYDFCDLCSSCDRQRDDLVSDPGYDDYEPSYDDDWDDDYDWLEDETLTD